MLALKEDRRGSEEVLEGLADTFKGQLNHRLSLSVQRG